MNSKSLMIFLLAATSLVAISSFVLLSDNGRAGNTGSPGETTCANSGCHTSFTVNSGPGSVYLTSNMTNWQYTPGQTYTINAIVRFPSRSLFGIGFEALTSTNNNAGTIVVTNSAKTQIKSATVSGVSRKNLVHQLNGGASPDSMIFTFNWIAPTTNIGNVTFYFAGVAANNSGNSSGDYVYNSSKIVTPASSSGLSEVVENGYDLSVVNLNQSGLLNISFTANDIATTNVELYDIKGSLVGSQNFGKQNIGRVALNFNMNQTTKTGIYVVKVNHGNQIMSKKIVLTF